MRPKQSSRNPSPYCPPSHFSATAAGFRGVVLTPSAFAFPLATPLDAPAAALIPAAALAPVPPIMAVPAAPPLAFRVPASAAKAAVENEVARLDSLVSGDISPAFLFDATAPRLDAFELKESARPPSGPARSGRIWKSEQIEALLKADNGKFEKAILSVPGVAAVRVGYGLENPGRAFLIVTVDPAFPTADVEAKVKAAAPEISGLTGILGAPAQVIFAYPGTMNFTASPSPTGRFILRYRDILPLTAEKLAKMKQDLVLIGARIVDETPLPMLLIEGAAAALAQLAASTPGWTLSPETIYQLPD